MKGTMIIIPPEGEISETRLSRPPDLDTLRDAVGGDLQLVPDLYTYMTSEGIKPCVCFCNEDGKLLNLPFNRKANAFWSHALPEIAIDVLVGTVVILTGDEEFMSAL